MEVDDPMPTSEMGDSGKCVRVISVKTVARLSAIICTAFDVCIFKLSYQGLKMRMTTIYNVVNHYHQLITSPVAQA